MRDPIVQVVPAGHTLRFQVVPPPTAEETPIMLGRVTLRLIEPGLFEATNATGQDQVFGFAVAKTSLLAFVRVTLQTLLAARELPITPGPQP